MLGLIVIMLVSDEGILVLSLLKTLPVARHAVLKYLAGVFDEAVNHHLLRSHVGAHSNNAGE